MKHASARPVIDVDSCEGRAAGCVRTPAGFEVVEPWGAYVLPEVEIKEGWYRLSFGDGPGAIHLELYDAGAFRHIELEALAGRPAYVRLSDGRYTPSVRVGARPGVYRLQGARLEPLPLSARYRLLAGRLFQALRSGMSFRRLVQLLRLATSRRGTYGVSATAAAAADTLGVLGRGDRTFDWSQLNAGERLARLKPKVLFLVESADGGGVLPALLDGQLYRNFTTDASQAHDFVVVVDPAEQLSPDALLLFAEYVNRNPLKQIVIADRWVDGQPTARVAWDPLLYHAGLPTPYARARTAEPKADFTNQTHFGQIGIPVAYAEKGKSKLQDYGQGHPRAWRKKPACSIIIPTRDRPDLLAGCLAGLFEHTDWPHEVIVVDNGSRLQETFALFDNYMSRGLKVLRADIPFNFSTLCNLGAAEARHDYLLFLNNDVELHEAGWLAEMMAYAVDAEIGAVGACLLYGDGRLQHGGVMLGLTELCGHLWRGASAEMQASEERLMYSGVRDAVTGACLLVEKAKFNTVNGFDALAFPVTLNDVDLCLKLRERGFHNVYAAKAIAYHLEGESRGEDHSTEKRSRRHAELSAFYEKWKALIDSDNGLPPCVSRSTERFQYR